MSATIIGICFLLHGIPVFAAESSEMIEFDLKTNEIKTVEIEEQNSDSVDSYIPEGSVLEFKHMERLLMVMIGIEFLLVYQVQLSHTALMML